MADDEKKIWGIHTKDDNMFLQKDVIAIGWKEMGDLSKIDANRDAFKEKYLQIYPDAKKGSVANGAGMLYRFVCEVQIGDYVVFPSKIDRMINLGVVEGGYEYDADAAEYVQQHKVKWLKHIPRTAFSQGALYEVGSAMSFFTIKNYADEYLTALDKGFKKTALTTDGEEDESVGATAEEIVESTKDFIQKELSKNLKGYALEEFVADLLRAMGYRTIVSAQGGDSGIDITAYKDELPPRILVQVKSQDGDIKEATIQSLMLYNKIWPDYYECDCSEENSSDYFYAKDKSMFDLMDDYGYYLTKDDEGPFLLILGKNGVTLVLPDTVEDSPFCKQIFDIVAYKLKVPAQKNY